MREIDQAKLQVERTSETDATVRYAGHYAGCVKMIKDGEYRCAVSMKRKGEYILQAFTRSDSIESGAQSVAAQWVLMHAHEIKDLN